MALVMLTLPAAGFAQGGGIAGAVTDSTGGVLPGVTVEAASPALIERVRTASTDGRGLYQIVNLRPGSYIVTFTLPGFSQVVREGLEVTTNFTATVNAALRVGALEETVTVSGASPVVDVQQVVRRTVITDELIDTLPTARNFWDFSSTIPGMTIRASNRPASQDVGGTAGQRARISLHGSKFNDMNQQIAGMPTSIPHQGGTTPYTPNPAEAEEFSFELGGKSVETATGGPRVNMIPKEGANVFSGSFFANYSNRALQSDNVTDSLRNRGLGKGNEMEKIWDVNPGFGGPIKRDKLWFFASARYWGFNDGVPDMWYDVDPHDVVYTPDLSRPAIEESWDTQVGLRLTWQATPSNKLSFYGSDQDRCQCHWRMSATRTPAASSIQKNPIIQMGQVSWTAPLTSRLLLEAGMMFMHFNLFAVPQDGVSADDLSITELTTGLNYRSADTGYIDLHPRNQNNYRGSLSYVTGSHALKFGFTLQTGHDGLGRENLGDLNLRFFNGVPRSVKVSMPTFAKAQLNAALGLFAEEQWTFKRLTLNLGLRLDYLNSSVPEQFLPGGRFVGPRTFAAVEDVPNWTDVSPRLGVAYDLFGTGRTALKAGLNKYMDGEQMGLTRAVNPVNTTVREATRTWNDLNGDFKPDCDFLDFDANQECGNISNRSFGGVVIRTRYDDAVREGFGRRGNNWEGFVGVQHEVMPGVSAEVSYHRRWWGNLTATDNREVTPADYDPFCISMPTDERLPGGGGSQICGLFDVNPAKFGLSDNFVTFSKNFGKQTEVYNGVDVNVNGRLPRGALVGGGFNTGRTATNDCFVVDSPEKRFCDISTGFQTRVKAFWSYPLLWDLVVSGTLQNLPGPEVTSLYIARGPEITPSLGRDLAAGARATKRVELIEPGTLYENRFTQVDFRITKIVQVGPMRLKAMFDLYNMLNSSAVLVLNTRFGPQWQRPTFILPGRLIKFGFQVDF